MKKTKINLISLAVGVSIGVLAGMGHIESLNKVQSELKIPEVVHVVNAAAEEEEKPEKKSTYYDPDIPIEVQYAAEHYGKEHNICPELLESIAFCESSYKSDAENGSCKGLMQINVNAQKKRMEKLHITEEDLWNPYISMCVASDLLEELFDKYEDVGVVLMLYNGDSKAFQYDMEGKISKYASKILKLSEELEEKHMKGEKNGQRISDFVDR